MIAKDLYRIRQKVELLEKELKDAPPEKREETKDQLRKEKAVLEKLQRMLDGAKEPLPYRKPL